MNQKSTEQYFAEKVDQLGAALLGFPWENRLAYATWLAQTYYFVKHTTVLVSMSAAKFGVADRAHHYKMLEHLADERGHDLLALNDLKALGFEIEEFPEYAETSLFYQNQYYMIAHQSPFSHLGYSLSLEGGAALFCPQVLERTLKVYGKNACEFIRVHATLDQDHYASGVGELKNLSASEAASAVKNLEQSVLLYQLMLTRAAKDSAAFTRNFSIAKKLA